MICWLHSYPSDIVASGAFMHALVEPMRNHVPLDLVHTSALRNAAATVREIRLLKNGRYALIHAQSGAGCGTVGAAARGARVLTLRGSDWYGQAPGRSVRRWLRSEASRRLTRTVLARYDTLIVVSECMQREVEDETGRIAHVVPSGIDLSRFVPADRAWARAQLGYADDTRPWVLFSSVRKDNPVKRPKLAYQAVVEAARSVSDLRLVEMTGIDPSRVPLVVAASNVVLLTSTHEGWPNIVKEGLACNVPFVSTDVSDLASIAHSYPPCAVVSADPGALGHALVRALKWGSVPQLRSAVMPMALGTTADRLMSIYRQVLPNLLGEGERNTGTA